MTEFEGFCVTATAELHLKLHDLGLELDGSQQQLMLRYLDLLAKWNHAYNLTSLPKSTWLSEILLDALVALPHIERGPILDVGSGAGLPGVLLAIARPDLKVTCLDSNGKKVRFINQVKIDLQIPNLDVVQSRVETFTSEQGYALIVSRAFAELDTFLKTTAHLLANKGQWLAWKGDKLDIELANLSLPVDVLDRIDVSLPGVAGKRYLIKLQKSEG